MGNPMFTHEVKIFFPLTPTDDFRDIFPWLMNEIHSFFLDQLTNFVISPEIHQQFFTVSSWNKLRKLTFLPVAKLRFSCSRSNNFPISFPLQIDEICDFVACDRLMKNFYVIVSDLFLILFLHICFRYMCFASFRKSLKKGRKTKDCIKWTKKCTGRCNLPNWPRISSKQEWD